MDDSKFANRPEGLHPLLRTRYSPRVFDTRAIPAAVLERLWQAAQWAPSCYNEQPWRFVFAAKDDAEAFARIASTLVPANAWAREAPVLGISVASTTFARNGKPNPWATHDVGQAMAYLTIQARAEHLWVHQMGGFNAGLARELLGIPDGFDPVAAFAMGYLPPLDSLAEEVRAKECAPGNRKPVESFVFRGHWR